MDTQHIQQIYNNWTSNVDASDKAELERIAADPDALNDAFYRDLSFGTAGLRGVLGLGSNRMNIYTVARATQGLATFLNAHFSNPKVAICRDSRNMGEIFMQTAAGVLAANGIKAYLYPRIEPTPALSFAVRDLGCSAGINITASHNPAEYNGYKVYGADGCQITSEDAEAIQKAIDQTDTFDGVSKMNFDEALSQGLAQWIAEDTLDRFLEAVHSQSLEQSEKGELSVVYTPLNGTGLECVTRILKTIDISDVTVVAEQADPDGNFPTCPYPNPEIREALAKGLELCDEVHPDLLLATDPDADRVGIAVPHCGNYVLLSGNEVGVLLLDYICKMRKERGEDLANKVAITTIVSSTMVDALARELGFELRRTLTGFKYIGEQIAMLESAGEEDRFIFGFEESYGYLAGSHVRDKDAIVASMLICQMARWHRSQGRDLVDAMQDLYQYYGFYVNKTISKSYPGADGAQKMQEITSGLRSNSPSELAGMSVESTVDYLQNAKMPIVGGAACGCDSCGFNGSDGSEDCSNADSPQTLPSADVIEFALEGGNKIIVRPSGTEPKIKAYLFAKGNSREEADHILQLLESAANQILA